MENPIFDHNSIENLVVSKNDPTIFDNLMPVFLYIPCEGAETAASIIQKIA